MEVAGYFLAVLIGIALGMIGGGGSILTIPVLVYFFDVEPVLAGGYSLFVVGVSSVIGVTSKFRKQLVDVKTAVIFGIPSIITVLFVRIYILPLIPVELFTIHRINFDRSTVMMLAFATLMIAASYSMIKNRLAHTSQNNKIPDQLLLSIQGAVVGLVTGFLGAGGGFLIIPALVLLSKLPMKVAVGTSLLIIAVNSLIGFFGNCFADGQAIEWTLLFTITALAIFGIIVGNHFGTNVDGVKLKRGFGWFILVTGIGIIFNELYQLIS